MRTAQPGSLQAVALSSLYTRPPDEGAPSYAGSAASAASSAAYAAAYAASAAALSAATTPPASRGASVQPLPAASASAPTDDFLSIAFFCALIVLCGTCACNLFRCVQRFGGKERRPKRRKSARVAYDIAPDVDDDF